MSKLFVDEIVHQSSQGSGTITIGASGETINVVGTLQNNGAGVGGTNTPAFEAYLSADQSVSDAVDTKVQINTEIFDTDGCYDNSTNYRFIPTVAGKYFVYARIKVYGGAASDLAYVNSQIFKNGSSISKTENNFATSYPRNISTPVFAVVDLNGTTDYVELFGQVDGATPGTEQFQANGGVPTTIFGAYKIIE